MTYLTLPTSMSDRDRWCFIVSLYPLIPIYWSNEITRSLPRLARFSIVFFLAPCPRPSQSRVVDPRNGEGLIPYT